MTAVKREVPFKKSSLVALRAILKGCAAEACEIRTKEIHKTEKGEKWYAWQKKRGLGRFTRHHLLAYGFLTGRAYGELESSREYKTLTTSGAVPYHRNIDIEFLLSICKQHAPQYFWQYARKKLTVDDLRAWIDENRPFFLTKEEILAKKAAERLLKNV